MMGRQMPVHDVISPLTVLREQLQKMLIVNQCNRRCLSSIISFALYQALLHFNEVLGIHKRKDFENQVMSLNSSLKGKKLRSFYRELGMNIPQ